MTRQHFSTIIVGRGLMGSAAARHLAGMQEGVAVVGPGEPEDKASHEGVFGSHYDEGRITRTIDRDPVWARLANRSIARYRDIERDSGVTFFTEAGALIAGPARSRGRYLETILAAAAACEAPAELVEAPETRFPCFAFAPKTEAVYETTNAGHISPRRLVAAQSLLAERAGASVIAAAVTKVAERGGRVSVETDDGQSLTADTALVAAGGFTINENLLPARIALTVYARTVAFFEISEAEAAALHGMPSLIYRPEVDAHGIYLLPPIRYPDGRYYIKIGGDPDDMALADEAAIRTWFRSEGRVSTREHLTRILCALMPKIRVLSTTTGTCVTSFSPSGYPMIGFSPSPRIAVLTAGNGAAAKSSDEIGRLGAVLMHRGTLREEGYGNVFAPAFL
ncbi:NAD(P)/FAD-dependent oxidoreductase [Martelella endophytica]|uniref:FAD-dependent oxidoreductase n=1 Tax=Martelella endophytica TaxID=1486262 RepID=A0A0D5LTU5_MAREN|nr:FAD-dependent oxidoreductase [Martelella endophytica]AJY47187.1 FAD-dependent oxidoreductase [Martelella endophytica]